MDPPQLLPLVLALGDREGRAQAAVVLARALGAEALLVFVRDTELGALVPAAGFPQTVPGGPSWEAFMAACESPGPHAGSVAFPDRHTMRRVSAYTAEDGTVLALVGAHPPAIDPNAMALPLLSPLLRAETATLAAAGVARAAQESARHAGQLAAALDLARKEQEAAVMETRRLNRELEQTALFREQVLGIVSHDLRSPLTAIQMGVELLQRRKLLDESGQRTVARIASSAGRMLRMIEELLDFTRTRLGGGIVLSVARVDLHDLCHQAVAEQELAHPDRRVIHTMHGDGLARVDEGRVSQVLSNLLVNAMKHGSPDGDIHLRSVGTEESVRIEVQNPGPTIPEAVQQRIFEPFYQTDGASRREGLGLGLFITDQIARAHKGQALVRSNAQEGTVFTIVLPRG